MTDPQTHLATRLAQEGMSHPDIESDACGVSLVAAADVIGERNSA